MSADRLFDVNYGLHDWQRIGKVRNDAPDTSKAAARLVAPRAGTKREQVLREIAVSDALGGATDEAICEALQMSPSTQRPRRVELVEMGWAQDSGLRRRLRSGAQGIVWQLTDRGRRAL